MELAGRKVLVVGLGRSGAAAARVCARRGARVTVTDLRTTAALAETIEQLPEGVLLELGGHHGPTFAAADLIVLSPGVPPLPEAAAAAAAGVEVIGEVELAIRLCAAPLVAVTGTNGKSTTTALAGALLARLGRPTFVGGNLGTPACDAVDTATGGPGGLLVLELSSFQLETVARLHARAAALLNLSEDHLDRYPTPREYAEAKARIFSNMTSDDVAVIHADQPACVGLAARTRAAVWWFSSNRPVEPGAWLDGDALALRLPGEPEERYPLAELPLVGRHNHENAMAAFLLARALGVAPADVRAAAAAFAPLPHRMQPAGQGRGLVFFDDSKATNVASVVGSLTGFPRRYVLIAGGRDKGGDLAPLRATVAAGARAVVLLGEAAERFAAALAGAAPLERATDMDDAVRRAAALARPGDAVVLSPACASYDMFRDYADRGAAFARAVRRWLEGPA